MRLNPHAREFVPGVSPQSCWSAQDAEDAGEDHITPEELAELEAVEDWVQLQAECEEWEHEFLIDIACELAPERVAEVEVAVACASPEAQQ